MKSELQIATLFEKKLAHMHTFEQITVQMLDCRAELLEGLVEQREQIVRAVDLIDAELEMLCSRCTDEAAYRAALRGTMPEGGISEHRRICDCAHALRAILSRLQESDCQAAMRLRAEQELILKQIKHANRGVGAQASKFYHSAFGGTGGANEFGNA